MTTDPLDPDRLLATAHAQPPQVCPTCGYRTDAACGLNTEDAPAPGDLSLCLNCMALGVYGDRLVLHPITAAEWDELPAARRRELREVRRAHARLKPAMGDLARRQRERRPT
jgi:hypothetical protein